MSDRSPPMPPLTGTSTGTVATVGGSKRGPRWTPKESLLLCQSFIAASEDNTEGTDMTSGLFQEKMFGKYKDLIQSNNEEFGTSYIARKAASNYNQFRRLSKYVLKYKAVEKHAGDPPSGDNDKSKYNEGIKNTFLKWHKDGTNLRCHPLLQGFPFRKPKMG
ncbi:hypothetical protein SEMRO_1436_G272470.1 [Seminavis robusta]|uniref:Myb/SANT-like domain-containing protein n=1 Tax=Seminavis robusta TaxID=568900 RepID=A0A9N8HSF1_9STRA|nr:hypothetical protein SEMRO_1436_G272470.1 [Seminavis robusta]|eukprot:Sro1436_g272470.1 n/a (162) ;mRNA; f:27688-28173